MLKIKCNVRLNLTAFKKTLYSITEFKELIIPICIVKYAFLKFEPFFFLRQESSKKKKKRSKSPNTESSSSSEDSDSSSEDERQKKKKVNNQ